MIICTMQSLSDDEKRQVLGEVLSDQLQAILEYVKEIPDIKRRITTIEEDVADIKITLQMHELDIRYLRSKIA